MVGLNGPWYAEHEQSCAQSLQSCSQRYTLGNLQQRECWSPLDALALVKNEREGEEEVH